MREWRIFQLRYLATKLIHQPDELAGVSIADSAIGRKPSGECRINAAKPEGSRPAATKTQSLSSLASRGLQDLFILLPKCNQFTQQCSGAFAACMQLHPPK